jgi:hypothetical protein
MKFALAATDARQSRNPQAAPETAPGTVSRPAPFAARLEVTPWFINAFDVLPTIEPKITIENQKSQF